MFLNPASPECLAYKLPDKYNRRKNQAHVCASCRVSENLRVAVGALLSRPWGEAFHPAGPARPREHDAVANAVSVRGGPSRFGGPRKHGIRAGCQQVEN